jgi:hypothetical protein
VIELPDPVVLRLAQGALPQAPTLRELRADGGSRVAVLDLILEVPAHYVGDTGPAESRVLGWDWGIRSLITASIVEPGGEGEKAFRQISRPVLSSHRRVGWAAGQAAPRD